MQLTNKYIKEYNDFNEDDLDYEEEEDLDWSFIDPENVPKKLEEFIKFLRENDAEIEYLNNLENSKNAQGFVKFWETKNDHFQRNPNYWIVDDFCWTETPEKHDFWSRLYKKWHTQLNKKKSRNFFSGILHKESKEWWDLSGDSFDESKPNLENDSWYFVNRFGNNKKIEKFINFLKNHDAEEKFLYNLENSKDGTKFSKQWTYKDEIFTYASNNWISYAFSWTDSIEGWDYWQGLHFTWISLGK